jgi:uncharacterized protein (DUF2336 family)
MIARRYATRRNCDQGTAMGSTSESVIAELELAVRNGSSEARIKTLRQVTDLFLKESDRLNDNQVEVFDDVLCLLIGRIESKALAELSKRLAPIDNSPIEVIRRLARDDEIVVAGPVLMESKRLTTEDLTQIAQTKSQAHMLAISGRDGLQEATTDVLVERGNRDVVYRLATNPGAHFSETGYGVLVKKAEADDALAEKVGLRLDIPLKLLRELLVRATEAVRSRLLSLASPEMQDEIRRVLAAVTNAVTGEMAGQRDFTAAEQLVRSLHNRGRLNDEAVFDFANRGKYEEMTAAIAVLCSAPLSMISGLMMGLRNDALLIPCKAAGLKWPTVEYILRHRHANHNVSDEIIALARNDFLKLSVAAAQKTLRFMQVHATVQK